MKNCVDPNQLVADLDPHWKPADLDLNCFQSKIYMDLTWLKGLKLNDTQVGFEDITSASSCFIIYGDYHNLNVYIYKEINLVY